MVMRVKIGGDLSDDWAGKVTIETVYENAFENRTLKDRVQFAGAAVGIVGCLACLLSRSGVRGRRAGSVRRVGGSIQLLLQHGNLLLIRFHAAVKLLLEVRRQGGQPVWRIAG